MLRIWKSIFYSQAFFTLHFFPTFATVSRVLRIWESLFYPQEFFTLNLPFQHLAQPAFIKAPLGVGSSSFNVAGHPTDVWNTDSAYLFESHSVQQKVLAGRFYLCVKALRNTIWTFSKFWTCSLIATYIVNWMFWMKFLMISGL